MKVNDKNISIQKLYIIKKHFRITELIGVEINPVIIEDIMKVNKKYKRLR